MAVSWASLLHSSGKWLIASPDGWCHFACPHCGPHIMCDEGFSSEIINFQFKLKGNKEIVFVSTTFVLDFNSLPKDLHLVKHATLGHCR